MTQGSRGSVQEMNRAAFFSSSSNRASFLLPGVPAPLPHVIFYDMDAATA
jgi:hypothetical protein